MAPVAFGFEVAEAQFGRTLGDDGRHAARYLASYEVLATPGRLVIEEDATAGEHAVGLAKVDGHPVRVELGDAIRAARIEGRLLVLRRRRQAEHLRRRRLVEARRASAGPNRFQQPGRAQPVGVAGVFGLVEGNMDLALGGQVVDLIGLHRHHQPVQAARVGHVAVVEGEAGALEVRRMRVLQVVDPAAVHAGRAAHHTVHFVTLLQQQLGEVRPVLAGDAGDQRALCHGHSVLTVRGIRSYPFA